MTVLIIAAGCSGPAVQADYKVVPLPAKTDMSGGDGFLLNRNTTIKCDPADSTRHRLAEMLSGYIEMHTGFRPALRYTPAESNSIIIRTDYGSGTPESYSIQVDKNNIVINGSDPAGAFYGIQTLRKSIPGDIKSDNILFPAAGIHDSPRFGYRGMMLDVSRHFFTVEQVKTYIDILALHNINRFHWHLTDDQGWRVEIKSYPALTETGAQRARTVIGRNSGKFDGIPYGGYFTQEQVRDVVGYAAERFITVVPEIDLPGHMLAALASYPELGCTGGPYKVTEEWGVFEDVLCAGNEEVFLFLEGVFSEITDMFPGEYIHVGGDECPKTRWKECPKCRTRIDSLGLKDDGKHTAEDKLQAYVIRRVERFLNSRGRKIIGWDEILEGGIAENATIMSWRGTSGGVTAAEMGHDVIMTPTTHLYFDYYQTDGIEQEPFAIGGYVPVKQVYAFDPIPHELSHDKHKHIIGVQGNMWTEYIGDLPHLQYMLLPRLGALAEIQWTAPERRVTYEEFLPRLAAMTRTYDRLGYNYATHIFDVEAKIESDFSKSRINVTLSTFDNTGIRYTLDGTPPNRKSPLYESPLIINESSGLRAIAIRDSGNSRIFSRDFHYNKATFKKVRLISPPVGRFTYGGANTLTDGIKGGAVFSNGTWLGFSEADFDAIIDLGEVTNVSEVSMGTYIDVNDWIFGAQELSISASLDGEDFREVFHEKYPTLQAGHPKEIITLTAFFPATETRYVKIVASPLRSLPEWSQGKGREGFIFVDEISVR